MWDDAFIEYTNLFRSRLGHCRVIASVNSNSQKPIDVLKKKVISTLFSKDLIHDTEDDWVSVLGYLSEKGFIAKKPKKNGRFPGLTLDAESKKLLSEDGEEIHHLEIHKVDRFLSDKNVPSTTGAPTKENIEEIIEFARDLKIINKTNQNSQVARSLNNLTNLAPTEINENPYYIGAHFSFYFYLWSRADFFMALPFIYTASEMKNFSRPDVVSIFPTIVENSIDLCSSFFPRRQLLTNLKKFQKLIKETSKKFSGKDKAGPGVLEHRVTPRLEYLVDIGFLTKESVSRNSFEYAATDRCHAFVKDYGDITENRDIAKFMSTILRSHGWNSHEVTLQMIIETFKEIPDASRSIPIDHLALICCHMNKTDNIESFYKNLFEAKNDRRVRFTGGRYGRYAEYVWISTK